MGRTGRRAVQPIRDKKQLTDFSYLLQQEDERFFIIWKIGINTGLRISDIINLTIGDVSDEGKVKDIYITRDQKTKKQNNVVFNSEVKKVLKNYIKDKPAHEVLFPSKHRAAAYNQPLRSETVGRVFKRLALAVGISEPINTHTMRKTMGYHMYKKTKDIALVMTILNHSDEAYTLRYIGINQEQATNAIMDLNL